MKTESGYAPREDSLAWSVIDFLKRRPGVYLEPADVVARFDWSTSGAAVDALADAVKHGYLRREWRQGCNRKVYLLGVGVPGTKPRAPQVGARVSGSP